MDKSPRFYLRRAEALELINEVGLRFDGLRFGGVPFEQVARAVTGLAGYTC